MSKNRVAYNVESRPPTEQELFDLQTKYLKTRDNGIWKEMFELCNTYARSLVLKKITGKKFLTPDEVNDASTNATIAFMSQYKENKDFAIFGSFAGLLKWKVLEALFKDYKEDDHSSFEDVVSSTHTLEDHMFSIGYDNFMCPNEMTSMEEKIEESEVLSEVEIFLKGLKHDKNLSKKDYLMVHFYFLMLLRDAKNKYICQSFIKNNFTPYMEKVFKDFKTEIFN